MARLPGQFHVPAGFNFELDTAVSLVQMFGNDVHRLGNAGLRTDAHAYLDPRFGAFQVRLGQLLGKRKPVPLGGNIPGGLIQRRFS